MSTLRIAFAYSAMWPPASVDFLNDVAHSQTRLFGDTAGLDVATTTPGVSGGKPNARKIDGVNSFTVRPKRGSMGMRDRLDDGEGVANCRHEFTRFNC